MMNNAINNITGIFICIVALAMVVLSILYCYKIFNTSKFIESFSIGVIVGIFSLLVTLLIGWNIYNAVDLNRRISELEEKNKILGDNVDIALVDIQNRTKEALENTNAYCQRTEEYAMGMTDFTQGLAIIEGTNKRYMESYRLFVSAISHFVRCDEQVTNNITTVLQNMEGCLDSVSTSEYSNIGEISSFYYTVNEIKNSKAKEFTTEQRKMFMELEERRERPNVQIARNKL